VSGKAIDIGSFRVGTALDGVDVDWRWMRPPSEGVGQTPKTQAAKGRNVERFAPFLLVLLLNQVYFLTGLPKKQKTFIFFC
jgi:hypothetical protein